MNAGVPVPRGRDIARETVAPRVVHVEHVADAVDWVTPPVKTISASVPASVMARSPVAAPVRPMVTGSANVMAELTWIVPPVSVKAFVAAPDGTAPLTSARVPLFSVVVP